jgi:hypothetical protein
MITTIKELNEDWLIEEWEEKTHNGKYRTNQLAQHREINQAVFDLVVKYKDTDNPLSNFLILLNNENSWYNSRKFAGRMADLSDEEIVKLGEEFFIYEDRNGSVRAEFVPEPGKSWGTLKSETCVSAFYIVQGTHPDRYNRHNLSHWDYPRDIDTAICSTDEEFKAIQRELFINGFGNYHVWDEGTVDQHTSYEFYDMSDERFTSPDKVKFIRNFEHISDKNIPLFFLYEEKENHHGEMVHEFAVDNPSSFGRGVLGYSHTCGCESNLNKVPQELMDEHLKIVERLPIIKSLGETMTIHRGTPDERTVSMEKRGEYIFIEGIVEKQKKILREKVEYLMKQEKNWQYLQTKVMRVN